MAGYVIQYNRITGDRMVTEFPGRQGHREALMLRLRLEKERKDADWEIVALSSDSLETIEKTHSRYFTGHLVDALIA